LAVAAAKKLDTGDKVRLLAPLAIYAILAFIAWKLGYFRTQKVTEAAGNAATNPWVGVGFVLVYALVASVALPVGPLAYGAGAIFGFWRGSILVWIGSMLGAVGGYHVARGIWSRPARRLLGRYKDKIHDLDKGSVFLNTFRLQLMPIIPFGVFNYAAGISELSLREFLAGTAVGIIPGTLMATFIGDRIIAGVRGEGKQPYLLAAGVALIVLALSFAPTLWEKLRERRQTHR